MNKLSSKLILGSTVALSLILAACGEVQVLTRNEKETLEKNNRVVEKINVQTASGDQLVQAAELLVDAVNFPLADELFTTALTINPNNKKAQFYKAFLKPQMLFKGYLHRLRPWARAQGREQSIDQFIRSNTLVTRVNSPLRDFLMANEGAPISSAKDMQTLLIDLQKAYNELRIWTKQNRSVKLSLVPNPYVFRSEMEKRVSEMCRVSEKDGQYAMDCPASLREYQIEEPDMLAIQTYAAGMVLWMNFYTAYSLENAEQADKILKRAELTKEPIANTARAIKALPGFLTFRNDGLLRTTEELGADYIAAASWVIENQATLCPGGQQERVRKGHLAENGACVQNPIDAGNSLRFAEQVLAGPVQVAVEDPNTGRTRMTEINYSVLWKSPIQDLKFHIPTEYNECGKPTSVVDNTLGGLFPNGDFNVTDTKCP